MLKEVKVRCFERQPFVRVIGGIVGCVWVAENAENGATLSVNTMTRKQEYDFLA